MTDDDPEQPPQTYDGLPMFARWVLSNGLTMDEAAELLGYDKSMIYGYYKGKDYASRSGRRLTPDLITRMAMAAIAEGHKRPAREFNMRGEPMRVRLALTAASLGIKPVSD